MCSVTHKNTCRKCNFSRDPALYDGGCKHPDYPAILQSPELEAEDLQSPELEPLPGESCQRIASAEK